MKRLAIWSVKTHKKLNSVLVDIVLTDPYIFIFSLFGIPPLLPDPRRPLKKDEKTFMRDLSFSHISMYDSPSPVPEYTALL